MRAVLIVDRLIRVKRDRLFGILSDFRHYDVWLPQANVINGTGAIPEGPISEGTTFVETGRWGTRVGTFTRMERPARICYRQPTTLRPAWLGSIGIQIEDSLVETEAASDTRLTRTVILDFQGPVAWFSRGLARSLRAEIERKFASLKAYAEAPEHGPGPR